MREMTEGPHLPATAHLAQREAAIRSETLCEVAAMIQAEAVAEDSQADAAVTLQHGAWHRARAVWLRGLAERILKL